jgi:hypothetical protein
MEIIKNILLGVLIMSTLIGILAGIDYLWEKEIYLPLIILGGGLVLVMLWLVGALFRLIL